MRLQYLSSAISTYLRDKIRAKDERFLGYDSNNQCAIFNNIMCLTWKNTLNADHIIIRLYDDSYDLLLHNLKIKLEVENAIERFLVEKGE